MKQRSKQRLEALSWLLSDGLMYSWFEVHDLDLDACKATLRVDTGDYDTETGDTIWKTVEIGPDDVARGLQMYREYMEGTREAYPGAFKHEAKDAVRAGKIKDESEFEPGVHNVAPVGAYGWQTVEYDRTNGEDGDYDANTADSVMQFATLGYTIFG